MLILKFSYFFSYFSAAATASAATASGTTVAHVSFAIDVTDMSSSCSEKTSSAATANIAKTKTLEAASTNTTYTTLVANGTDTGNGINTCGSNGQLQRVSATSTITSDYFSMNSKEVTSERPTAVVTSPRVLTANGCSGGTPTTTSSSQEPRVFPQGVSLYPHVVDVPPCSHVMSSQHPLPGI